MPEVHIEDYEKPALSKLLSTYHLNTDHDGKGMTPDPHHRSFCRQPAPTCLAFAPLFAAQATDKQGGEQAATLHAIQVPWAFECMLYQLQHSRIFDGGVVSTLLFTLATGLSPLRFVQAWCETEGSAWRWCHPAATGKEVAEALCGYWVVKVKHWKTIPDHVIRKEILSKVGGTRFKLVKEMLEGRLGRVIEIANIAGGILRHITVTASSCCAAHPTVSLCGCAVALDMSIWEELALKNQAFEAFTTPMIFDDETFGLQEGGFFDVRRDGQTYADFAQQCIDRARAELPMWKAADRVVVLLALLFWTVQSTAEWRTTCRTKREARTRYMERLKEDVRKDAEGKKVMAVDFKTGVQCELDPHEQLGTTEDPLCRYVRTGQGAPAGHQHTVVLYAVWEKGGVGLRYDVLRVVPCHEECKVPETRELDMLELTAVFADGDAVRARAARAEW
ncbi:hypothetical protein LTR36_009850 [Oleoguttula mirabilis]|uniref:Uncharacterized protein n=1 Tax=Oleoguttula mirabilis TaxID=1507867 RepID=A0AAV9J5X6_9PEZI|nr:hypothetical protein LTR36_009850 [Oleoguttula mirabilis]